MFDLEKFFWYAISSAVICVFVSIFISLITIKTTVIPPKNYPFYLGLIYLDRLKYTTYYIYYLNLTDKQKEFISSKINHENTLYISNYKLYDYFLQNSTYFEIYKRSFLIPTFHNVYFMSNKGHLKEVIAYIPIFVYFNSSNNIDYINFNYENLYPYSDFLDPKTNLYKIKNISYIFFEPFHLSNGSTIIIGRMVYVIPEYSILFMSKYDILSYFNKIKYQHILKTATENDINVTVISKYMDLIYDDSNRTTPRALYTFISLCSLYGITR